MHGAVPKIVRFHRLQPPASTPNPPESNRESIRLETRVTQTKQTSATVLIGKIKRFYDPSPQSPLDPQERPVKFLIGNQRVRALMIQPGEIMTTYHSNRENEACFQRRNPPTAAGPGFPPAQVAVGLPPPAVRQRGNPTKTRSKRKLRPPTFVAIKKNSAVYFVQLTTIFNLTM